jgi:hypothetical protein
MTSTKRIPLPEGLGLSQSNQIVWVQRGDIYVQLGGKAPKRRFSPGQFIWAERQLWEIICAYRVADDPSEWLYDLEERQELKAIDPSDGLAQVASFMGAGSRTPRVFMDVFLSRMDAHTYFGDIPMNADRKTFSNKMLLQGKAEIRSSGEVIDQVETIKRR